MALASSLLHSIRTAAADTVRAKLSQRQLKTLLANRCVLLLHMGKLDEVQLVADELRQAFPNAEEPWLVDAALLRKQKKSVDEQLAVLTVRVLGEGVGVTRSQRSLW